MENLKSTLIEIMDELDARKKNIFKLNNFIKLGYEITQDEKILSSSKRNKIVNILNKLEKEMKDDIIVESLNLLLKKKKAECKTHEWVPHGRDSHKTYEICDICGITRSN